MVLNAMEFREKFLGIPIENPSQCFRYARELYKHFGALASERGHAEGVPEFCCQAGIGIAGDGYVVDFAWRKAGFLEAVADCGGRESGGIFYAVETFLFHGGDELAVAEYGCGGVAVIGVDAKNVHLLMR